MYKLEAYDKDNDIYSLIAESKDINYLKCTGINLDKNFILKTRNGEPVDWLLISSKATDKVLFVLSGNKWIPYQSVINASIYGAENTSIYYNEKGDIVSCTH